MSFDFIQLEICSLNLHLRKVGGVLRNSTNTGQKTIYIHKAMYTKAYEEREMVFHYCMGNNKPEFASEFPWHATQFF
jgi:hypothetical protein